MAALAPCRQAVSHGQELDHTGGLSLCVSARRDYASAADFTDPGGNARVIQEIGYRRALA